MQSEIVALQREVAALKQQVQGRRKRFKIRVIAAMLAAFVAFVPLSLLAANPFNDLVPGSVHNANIDAIYNAGITTGCVPNQSYCPTDLVTRQEMASFLARTAGLGNNPPVANARTVQGFQANSLSRIGVASSQDAVYTLNNALQVITTVSIIAPGPGFIHVQGALTLRQSPNGGAAVVTTVVGDNATGFTSYPLLSAVGSVSGYAYEAAASPTTVFRVSSAGTYTYSVAVGRDSFSTGITYAQYATITATFTPFGAGGAQGAEDRGAVTHISTPIEVTR